MNHATYDGIYSPRIKLALDGITIHTSVKCKNWIIRIIWRLIKKWVRIDVTFEEPKPLFDLLPKHEWSIKKNDTNSKG